MRRLTSAKPDLLQTALDEIAVVVARAEGALIEMLYSDGAGGRQDPLELGGADHPLSPARR